MQVSQIFATIQQGISGLAESLTSAVTSITGIFYTPASEGVPGGFTFLGILTLVGLAAGLVFLGVRWIMSAVRGVAR